MGLNPALFKAPLRVPDPRQGDPGPAAQPGPVGRGARASHQRTRPGGTGYTAFVPAGVSLWGMWNGGWCIFYPLKQGFRPGTCGPLPRLAPAPRATHAWDMPRRRGAAPPPRGWPAGYGAPTPIPRPPRSRPGPAGGGFSAARATGLPARPRRYRGDGGGGGDGEPLRGAASGPVLGRKWVLFLFFFVLALFFLFLPRGRPSCIHIFPLFIFFFFLSLTTYWGKFLVVFHSLTT